jgi:hypothetical protein
LKPLKTAMIALAIAASAGAAAAQGAATIEDAAWLAGRWVGEGPNGQLEETWAPPVGGHMVGHFRLMRDGAPVFYEIMLMDVFDGRLRLRVKHFTPAFVGWEGHDEWHAFEPVSHSADELVFTGLTLRRLSETEFEALILIRYPDGVREDVLRMRRAPM